jgi:hypothetical protein
MHYPDGVGSELDHLGAAIESLKQKLNEIENQLDSALKMKKNERED